MNFNTFFLNSNKKKILAFFNGGINSTVGDTYEKSLAKLDKTLDYEINTFTTTVNGIVARPQTFYVGQTINSDREKVNKNSPP